MSQVDAYEYMKRGVLFKQQGEIEKALQNYNMAIKLNPNYSTAYYNRGVLFKQQEEIELALQDYNTAIKLNPNYATAYYNRGNLFKQQGQIEIALQDYNTAIKLNPNDADVYYNRGNLFKQQGQIEIALQDYKTAINLNPNDADAYYNRGNLFKQQGQIEKALQDYNTAINLNQNDADAYYNRGVLFYQQEQIELALQDYNTAIKLNPNYVTAYYSRGVLFDQRGEKEQALLDYKKALLLEPNHPLILTNLGSFYFKQKQFDQTNLYFAKAQKSLDQITNQQIQKWNLSNQNLSYIKKELKMLKDIQIQIQITDLQLEYLSKGQQRQKTKQLEEQVWVLVNEVIQQRMARNLQLNQNLQKEDLKIIQQQIRDLQNQITSLTINVNSLLEQDNCKVSESLKQVNKKENNNQWMYYAALAWRLYNYLSAMQQISTNLFQINKDAIIESQSEQILNVFQKILNKGSQIFGELPIVGSAFNIINAALDFGFEQSKEHKFTTRLKKLNNILKCSSILPNQLQIEIQIASLELSKNQLVNLMDKPKSRFRKFVDQLLKEEDKQFRDNIYWAAGSEDALIILNYLEVNSEMITNEILNKKAIKEQNDLSESIQTQQQGNENRNNVKVADKSSLCIVQ